MRIVGLIVFSLLVGCGEGRQPLAGAEPKSLPPEEISKIAAALPSYAHFSVSGVAFLGDRLFVATNIGLIEVHGLSAKALHRWYEKFNVVSGPWSDAPRGAIWAHRADDGHFVRHDKNGWQRIDLPKPPKGYFSRGDFLEGFVGLSEAEHFRLIGAGAVWRFENGNEWVLEPSPRSEEFSAVAGFGRVAGREVYVVRRGGCPLPPCDYGGYWRENGQWRNPVAIPIGSAKETISTKEGVFVRSANGELFRLEIEASVQMKIPGPCEAIARTSTGSLLTSFRGTGIHVLANGSWQKLLDDPYTTAEGEHRAYLAESNGRIALATASVPHLKPGTDSQWNYSGTDAVWVSEGRRLMRVELAK